MSDNISRRATLEAIQRHFNPTGEEMPTEVAAVLVGVGVVISTQPSTDRKGHWIAEASDKILGQLNWSCSECGEGFALDIGKCPSDIGMNYCTNCGADMRGVDDESTL